MDYEFEFQKLVDTAFENECKENPDYFSSLDARVHRIIYRDTRYNIDFLYTAYVLNDNKIIENYSCWLYQLMYSILKLSPDATANYVIRHLDSIKRTIPDVVSKDKQDRLIALIECAENSIRSFISNRNINEPKHSRYETEINRYMDSLFKKNLKNSLSLIGEFINNGIPVCDIYAEILTESMRRIGDLWHTAKITVDVEHYCTSVTQTAIAQLYPIIFSSKRKNKTILCTCPGGELHEMGARMVADIFENDGWDSIYLGAAIPEDAILYAVRENRPDLIALSVTMPQHLIACRNMIAMLKKEFPEIPIAVGGNAFEYTNSIWKQWNIDIYTSDARELLVKANELC